MSEPVILHKERTVSTMDDARLAIRNGRGHWTVCRANHQSGGRGRIPGRHWLDSEESLLFTLIIDKKKVQSEFPLTQLLALALCRYLESEYNLEPVIKWPNDVLLNNRKIAGILVEVEQNYFLAGIGLNIGQTSFPFELRRPAVSLAMLVSEEREKLSPEKVLNFLLAEFDCILSEQPDIEDFESRLEQKNQQISVLLGDPGRNDIVTGTVEGINHDGALILLKSDGERQFVYSGELV